MGRGSSTARKRPGLELSPGWGRRPVAVNPGDRVITPDGPGVIRDTRKEKDVLHGGKVLRGRLWLWVKLDARPKGLEIYTGKQVRPEP